HRDVLTKAEAVTAHQRLSLGVDDGDIQIGDRSLTVKAMATSFIARERGVLATRSTRTVELYEQRLEQHVIPELGTTKAVDVTVQHIRALIDKLTAQGHGG